MQRTIVMPLLALSLLASDTDRHTSKEWNDLAHLGAVKVVAPASEAKLDFR